MHSKLFPYQILINLQILVMTLKQILYSMGYLLVSGSERGVALCEKRQPIRGDDCGTVGAQSHLSNTTSS